MKTRNTILFIGAAMLAASTGALAAKSSSAPIFYPDAPDAPRLQFLKTINGSNFLSAANNPYGNRFPGFSVDNGKDPNPIVRPFGLAVSGGSLFIADAGRSMVQIYDLEKKTIGTLGEGKLKEPSAIVVGADGRRYVADIGTNKIFVFDAKNKYVTAYGNPAKVKPVDLVLANGKLYVADTNGSQILVLDPATGKELARFGHSGAGESELVKPSNITADADGNLYVTDALKMRIAEFDANGNYIRSIGKPGDSFGKFTRPKSVAVARDGNIYASDSGFENIQIFDKAGKLLLPFLAAGDEPGNINMPSKVLIDYDNVKFFADAVAPGYSIEYLVFVASHTGQNKINVYAFLKKS